MNSTNADSNARRAQRDQGTRDLCNPDYVRVVLATAQNVPGGQASTCRGQTGSQTGGQSARK
jgi:hypothetical protein